MKKYACFKIDIGGDGKIKTVHEYPKGMRTKKLPCIYAFLYQNKIIRVGEGSLGYSRIREGLNQPITKTNKKSGNSKRNYYAYKWREKYKNKSLSLIMFQIKQPKLPDAYKIQKWRRSVEAEITYEIRQVYGHWPKAMNEVHFEEAYRNRKDVQK